MLTVELSMIFFVISRYGFGVCNQVGSNQPAQLQRTRIVTESDYRPAAVLFML